MQTEMCMMENGLMIKHMALVFIVILMELSTRGSGKRISSMEMA